jgi:integrase
LFVKADGTPKSQAMVALLIKTYLRKRAGIEFTSHQFRHLCAKIILDSEPGNFETVRQLLGQTSLKTTTSLLCRDRQPARGQAPPKPHRQDARRTDSTRPAPKPKKG